MQRSRTDAIATWSGRVVATAVAAGWLVLLARILRLRIFITNDTMVSYAHVWFIASRLWDAHRFPLAMPIVDHGRGVAFPYGVVPWLAASGLRPALGDRAVTFVLVAGTLALVATTFVAFPELRRPWEATAVLVNPALVFAPLLGQTVFVAAAALLMGAIAAWRSNRWVVAAVLAGLAVGSHAAIVGPLAGALAALTFASEPSRRRQLVAVAVVVAAIAAPFVAMTMAAPVVADTSTWARLVGLAETLAARFGVFALPLLLIAARGRRRRQWPPAVIAVALVAAGAIFWEPLGLPWAARGLQRAAKPEMAAFVRSPAFRRGHTYRILRIADGKLGAYQLLRAGARLDADFFPEDLQRRSWPSQGAYLQFLDARKVDDVMLWEGYDRRYPTNEHRLLRELSAGARCGPGETRVTLEESGRGYDLYAVRRACGPVMPNA